MTLIRLRCPCGKRLKVATQFAGKTGKCPKCGKMLPIPTIADIHDKLAELNLDIEDVDSPAHPSRESQKGSKRVIREQLYNKSKDDSKESFDEEPSVYLNVASSGRSSVGYELEDELDKVSEPELNEEIRKEIDGLIKKGKKQEESLEKTSADEKVEKKVEEKVVSEKEKKQVKKEEEKSRDKEIQTDKESTDGKSKKVAKVQEELKEESPTAEDTLEALPEELDEYGKEKSPPELMPLEDALESSSIEAEALENSRIIRALNLDPVEEILFVERPEHLVNKGEEYCKEQDFDKAILVLTKAIIDSPKLDSAYYQRANVFQALGAWDLALQDLKKAQEYSQNPGELNLALHNLILEKTRWLRSIKAYNQAFEELKQSPNREDKSLVKERLENYWARANYFMEIGALEAALCDLDTAVSEGLSKTVVIRTRGKIRAQLRRFSEAVEDFSKLIDETPDTGLYRMRADAYYELEKFDKAIDDLNHVIEESKGDHSLYQRRGECYAKLKRYQEAIKDFTAAVEIDSMRSNHYFQRGLSYISIKDYEKAIHDFSQVIELDPRDYNAYLHRGYCYRDKPNPNPTEAMKDFRKAEELRIKS